MNFWELFFNNLVKTTIIIFISAALITGAYNIDDLIRITEKVAINLSKCS